MNVRDGTPPDQQLAIRGVFHPADLADIRRRTADYAHHAGLPDADVQRMTLAVNEAVTNVIRHAAGDGDLTVFVDRQDVVAEVVDSGPGFVDAEVDAELSRDALSGRGLWLMRRCVDTLSIVSQAAGTRIRMAFTLPRKVVVYQ